MAKTAKKRKRKAQRRMLNAQRQGKQKSFKKPNTIRPARIFIYAVAVAAIGGGGYLAYDRIRKRKFAEQNVLPSEHSSDTIIINNSLPVSYSNPSAFKLPASGSDDFPLKRGSKGTRVRMLQQALAKTTPSILVDGIYGPQTAGALKAAGYPEIVDEALFARITGSGNGNIQVVFNPASLASGLYKSAQNRNLNEVLNVLRQMKTISDYSSVNEYYKRQSFISKTIVTDLLEYAFKGNEAAKDQIRNEFLRIGLKVNIDGTWSLQGLRLYKDLVTIRETVLTDSQNNRIPVRRNTILGDELEVANGMTWFKSIDNTVLKAPTQDVKYT